MSLKVGGLFAGYGGLEMGVSSVLDAEPAWFSEYDKGPSKILAHRFPGVPNHGDITRIDWATVEPVDILTGGSPCQDLSHAGKRAGMTEGTRSNLWVAMREAIAQLRPGLVIWENVRGAFSAEATSGLVDDPRLLAGTRRRDGEPVLRALGRVLGDLSELGYDAQWHGLRAADVGAPHGRFRVFVVARIPGTDDHSKWAPVGRAPAATARETGSLLPTPAGYDGDRGGPQHPDKRRAGGHAITLQDAALLFPTPMAGTGTASPSAYRRHSPDIAAVAVALPSASLGTNRSGEARSSESPVTDEHLALFPTPAVNDMGAGKTVEEWDAWTERMKAEHSNGNGHGKSLSIEAARLLLPTPKATNNENQPTDGFEGQNFHYIIRDDRWGQYAAAIARWERLTRDAPAPTELGPKGGPRLSPAFPEWLMGLPAGWVTDVPGITRSEALKAIGNGVCPQQASAALRLMLGAADGGA